MKKAKLMRMKVGEGILIYGVIGLFILLALVPFLCLISGSFSESDLLRDYGVALWPRGFTSDAYRLIFMFPEDILNSYYYSILITVIGTIGNMLLLTSVAYVLSRPALRGKKYMSMFFFFTLMFNPGIVPTFILYDYLGMYDTIWALIFPGMMSVGYLYFCAHSLTACLPNFTNRRISTAPTNSRSCCALPYRSSLPVFRRLHFIRC